MERTLGELASLLGGELKGPADLVIRGIAALDGAGPQDISFISEERYLRLADQSQAGAFIVAPAWANLARPMLIVAQPYLAYAQVATLFAPPRRRWPGVSHQAYLGAGVELGEAVSIAPLVFVGDGVRLGDRVTIMPGCVIGDGVQIGADTLLHPNVTVLERCRLGQRVIIHSGTVIGSDGYGFVPTPEGNFKIPQLGTVVLEDDVEVGANCAIDRGALGETRLKQGVKVDNLVQIAHNVVVGENSLVVAQVGISGSTKLGKRVVLAGQVGVAGHLELGDGVQVGAQAGVRHSLAPGQVVIGSPAWPRMEFARSMALLHRLPEIYQRLQQAEKKLAEISGEPPKESES